MSILWYAFPVLVSVSLVYGATRHEDVLVILRFAWHTFIWLFGFMATLFVIIWLMGLWL